MAKDFQDREDLLRDATALITRGRFWIIRHNAGEPRRRYEVVIGFRNDGSLSLYWDQDPVFQFDASQRLRRVFIDAKMYRADASRLCSISKRRRGRGPIRRVRLTRSVLSDDEQIEILNRLEDCLSQIRFRLTATTDDIESIGQSHDQFAEQIVNWIDQLTHPVSIAE